MTVRKPFWTEGLFISEHHLQEQDRYHEAYVDSRLAALGRPSWGVLELEWDTDALGRGQLLMTRVLAVMPDGTPLDCGIGADAPPPMRDINEKFGPALRSLPVYLAIPGASPSRGNVGVEGTSSGRFARTSGLVADYNAGGREHEVNWVVPQTKILVGDESREGYSTLQVADLLRTANGTIVCRDTFVPPCLALSGSTFLYGGARRIANAVVTRARAVAATRRQRSDSRVEFDAGDVSKMLLLATLNRAIPVFSHFAESEHIHPEEFYVELAALAGELCSFVPDVDPASLPKYSYLNLGDTFEPLIARALSLINTMVDERYVEVPLKRREDGMYLGRVEDPRILRHEFFLAARGTLSEAELHQQLPKLSKIASWGQIGALLNAAVNGARVELEFRPSSALPIRPGVSFFKIQKTPEYWPDIQGTGTIAIYHPLGQEAVSLSLYAVDPENL